MGGNLANASPAADLAVVLLALRAHVTIDGPRGPRDLALAGSSTVTGTPTSGPGDVLVSVSIPRNRERQGPRLHAEKVARRTHDDIASVCSTMVVASDSPDELGASHAQRRGSRAGPGAADRHGLGIVRPGPHRRCRPAALNRLAAEIAPIDDVRGSAAYKATLLRHLVLAHLAALCPGFDYRAYLR